MQAYGVRGSAQEGGEFEYADDVVRVATGIVNAYLIGTSDYWILVDTGIAGFAALLKRAVAARFGPQARPAAIVLTHGHFDHAGNAEALALEWNVPVLAHPLELPYLNGASDYPPQDPTVGGAIACMSRVFPYGGRALQAELFSLSGDTIPGLPQWRWLHTPGHTAGHISLFRPSDRTLIAGDALATMDMDSWVEQVRRTPEPCNPPAPLTTDWAAARRSVQLLADLEPRAIGAGHGLPIAGDGVAEAVRRFADGFTPPAHGRYVAAPAVAGPEGIEWIPPVVPDPFPRRVAGVAMVALGAWGLARAASSGRRSRQLRRA
jgi:glyoxylase-like metal-dependent hydrolase (beta-lactamase superfamily II)